MTKNQALSLIEELQTEINIENVRKQFWMDKAQGFIQFIFGDSTQSIALPMFGTYYHDRPFDKWNDDKASEVVEKLQSLFSTYEQMINNGVYFRKNILSGWTSPEIKTGIAGIFVAVLMTFGTIFYQWGNAVGESTTEYKLIELQSDYFSLDSSFTRLKNKIRDDKAKGSPEKGSVK